MPFRSVPMARTARRILLCLVVASIPTTAMAFPVPHGKLLDAKPTGGVTAQTFPKWGGVMNRTWARQASSEQVCNKKLGLNCQLNKWQGFLRGLQGMDRMSVIRRVNSYMNAVTYRSDQSNWRKRDYWAGPGEFFARGGDCEDYAIAKYYSLKQLGFSAKDMRIVVLKDASRNLMHAVLSVKYNGQFYVLDNTRARVITWKDVPFYQELYSVNENSYWLHMLQRS